ncbi:MAG: MBL fold metallo-hydrolase [Nitrospinae bacterium]|jgi:cyclase|nr:MBL fold metallo-hydrolase [Nitrospinota bacterium]MDA1109723.1 MBL fold metallo-hydrolase [Nitrospinota bacterium]
MVVKNWKIVLFVWIVAGFLNVLPLSKAAAKTVEVLPNIFTIVHGEGSDSNTTFIITKEGVIVIDTGVSPAEAEKVMAEITKRTDLPIVYTINTHYHGDHTFGNQVFRSSKTIIAHKNVRRSLIGASGKEHLKKFKALDIPGLDAVQVTPPTMIYEKNMELYLGGYHLQLVHLGRGHTDGDTLIILQELRTVIAGGLIYNRQFPDLGDGYVEEWIAGLQYLEDQDNELVIPGHGDVGGKPIIIAMKHYLITLKSLVLEQVKKGKNLKETKEILHPVLQGKYESWGQAKRIDSNIERAYLEYSFKEGL